MRYNCPSCKKKLRFRVPSASIPTRGVFRIFLENNGTDACGYCPFCGTSLARNIHEAETRSGRIIFPALIIAAICIVLFVYLLYEWLLILVFVVVVFALIIEQISISRQIPGDWPRWHIVGNKVAEPGKANMHLLLGALWLAISVIVLAIQIHKWSWLNISGIFIGICWVAMGIRVKYITTKSSGIVNK